MQSQWKLFHNGGVNSTELSVDPWITIREVTRNEILILPPSIYRTRKRRKTLDFNNWLLTREYLNKYDDLNDENRQKHAKIGPNQCETLWFVMGHKVVT